MEALAASQPTDFPPSDEELDCSTYLEDRADGSPPPPWLPIGGWDLSLLREMHLQEHRAQVRMCDEEQHIAAMLHLEESLRECEWYEWFTHLFPNEDDALFME